MCLFELRTVLNSSNFAVPHWTRPRVMKKQLHAEPAGNTVVFQCKAAGPKPLNCTWYKDGIRVLKEERIGEYKVGPNFETIIFKLSKARGVSRLLNNKFF